MEWERERQPERLSLGRIAAADNDVQVSSHVAARSAASAASELRRMRTPMADTNYVSLRYRAITAQAWSGMLAVLLTMLIADVVRFSMQGPYSDLAQALAADPGRTGLWILVCLICLNALIQVAVHTFEGLRFRVMVYWASVAYTAFFIVHQIAHVVSGEGFSLHTILDVTHHTLGLWACWASRRWARSSHTGGLSSPADDAFRRVADVAR